MINKMQNHLERNIHILAGFVDWTDEMEVSGIMGNHVDF